MRKEKNEHDIGKGMRESTKEKREKEKDVASSGMEKNGGNISSFFF